MNPDFPVEIPIYRYPIAYSVTLRIAIRKEAHNLITPNDLALTLQKLNLSTHPSYLVFGTEEASEALLVAWKHLRHFLTNQTPHPPDALEIRTVQALRHNRKDSANTWMGYDFAIRKD